MYHYQRTSRASVGVGAEPYHRLLGSEALVKLGSELASQISRCKSGEQSGDNVRDIVETEYQNNTHLEDAQSGSQKCEEGVFVSAKKINKSLK